MKKLGKRILNFLFYLLPIALFIMLSTMVCVIVNLIILEVDFIFILGWIEAALFCLLFFIIDLWAVIGVTKLDKKERLTPTKETMKYKGRQNG